MHMPSNDIRSLTKKRYTGTKTSIVIGVDVGTTFSGVSYAILRPDQVPQVRPVTRFSDQSERDSKIPSVIYYDLDDYASPKAIGAATIKNEVICKAEEQGWIRCDHFKMHLRPRGQTLKTNGLTIGDLPPGRTAEDVMGDFLRYLVDETGRYISRSHATTDGEDLWQQVKDDAVYVLGHPNGWSGYSQQRYRTSAVLGGLVPDSVEGRKRIKFVTEGEASALSCLVGGLGPSTIRNGFRFIIADAGGGTVDTTTFEVVGPSLRELSQPDCRFAGSVFVNMRARDLLQRKLADSKYEDMIEDLIGEEFEFGIKRQFDGEAEKLLKIGGRRETDKKLGIAGGFLTLQRDEIAACFNNCISEIVDSIRCQFAASGSDKRTTPVWLVGGFGSSEYLLRELKRIFEQDGATVQTPDTNRSKAVADGAVLHYLYAPVRSRVCPKSYVTVCCVRIEDALIGPLIDIIAEKGASIDVDKTFAESYTERFLSRDLARQFSAEVLCYDGDLPVPRWYDENKEKFRTVCRLEADLSSLCREPSQPSNIRDAFMRSVLGPSWDVSFDIELKFGTTEEVEAKIKWEDNGVTKEGPPVEINWLQ